MTGNAQEIINWLFNQEKDKLYEIKEYKEKRKLSQNAYSWKLQTMIANKLKISKEEVHFDMLKHYGQSEIVSLLEDINYENYFTYCEEIGKSELNGKVFRHIKVYKPTHKMDTKEMSIFIDGVVQEAEQLGIETMKKEAIKELELL